MKCMAFFDKIDVKTLELVLSTIPSLSTTCEPVGLLNSNSPVWWFCACTKSRAPASVHCAYVRQLSCCRVAILSVRYQPMFVFECSLTRQRGAGRDGQRCI